MFQHANPSIGIFTTTKCPTCYSDNVLHKEDYKERLQARHPIMLCLSPESLEVAETRTNPKISKYHKLYLSAQIGNNCNYNKTGGSLIMFIYTFNWVNWLVGPAGRASI